MNRPLIGQISVMRTPLTAFLAALALWLGQGFALRAEMTEFPARSAVDAQRLVIYSTLDTRLAAPLLAAFQDKHPDVALIYEDLLASEIAERVVIESDAGGITADFVFSSAMDQQMKLANDGYAQAVAASVGWPRWANWRDTAFALTVEPAVLIYHRPSFPDGPPQSRLELIEWLRAAPESSGARIGTYDIEQSAVGYLYLSRDAEHFADIWVLLRAMALAGIETFPTSQDVIDRVADGRLALGYNILGPYAEDQADRHPGLGVVRLSDFTVAISRVGLVPRAAAAPDLGEKFLSFLMTDEGQRLLEDRLRLPAVRFLPESSTAEGRVLRLVPVSPGLLAYLDQSRHRSTIRKWRAALGRPE
ncbi:MAG: ABC transporter substrate-binding protein [Paracoccaceae bacterium]